MTNWFQADEFSYADSGAAKGVIGGGWTEDGKTWKNAGRSIYTKPAFQYTGGRLAGPEVSKWDQYASDKLKNIKPRINASHLMDPASRHKTPVYFLRGGKQWALVIG